MVRFEKVGMRYAGGRDVLRGIDLDLPQGSFRFLTGPSGAGKSTLLRLMYLADRPTVGTVSLFGRDVRKVKRRELPGIRRRIGVVFQDFRLLDHLSAFDNVALPLRIGRVAEDVVRANVRELLHWVGLSDNLNAKPSTLSGGEQQRIAIARAVITQPALLIADEPTGNVDDMIALRLLRLFEELNRLGTTVVIATHNLALVEEFGHPCFHIEAGALELRPGSGRGMIASRRTLAPRPEIDWGDRDAGDFAETAESDAGMPDAGGMGDR